MSTSNEYLTREIRKQFNDQWLKQFKGLERLSKKKADEILESMIELSVLLGHYILNNQNTEL